MHIKSTDLSQLAINGNQLRLALDPAQELTFSTDAVLKSPAIVDGVFVHLVQLGSVEVESEPGRQWQNPVNHFNVNVQSSGVSALDALIVINELGRRESSELPLITDLTDFQGNYYDVSGDGLLTALDALQVINQLARIKLIEVKGNTSRQHFQVAKFQLNLKRNPMKGFNCWIQKTCHVYGSLAN